jgi:Cysteine-rich secretory protein family
MRASSILSSCLTSLLTVCAVHADSPTRIEIAGLEGCSGKQPAAIESSEALDDVARELSLGVQLNDAIDRVGYASAGADSLYLKTARPMNDDAVRKIVVDRYCAAANEASFKEFGTFRDGKEAWIVLASPMDRPAVLAIGDPATVASHVLELVNAARAQSRRCGDRELPAARPLRLSPTLTDAADRHARDMAQHGTFAHLGSDGTKPSERGVMP